MFGECRSGANFTTKFREKFKKDPTYHSAQLAAAGIGDCFFPFLQGGFLDLVVSLKKIRVHRLEDSCNPAGISLSS